MSSDDETSAIKGGIICGKKLFGVSFINFEERKRKMHLNDPKTIAGFECFKNGIRRSIRNEASNKIVWHHSEQELMAERMGPTVSEFNL